MMTMNVDCRQVRELMDSYISGELTVESNHDVLRHTARCEGCRDELQRRERMGMLLIESFGPPPDATAIGACITQALDREQHRWGRLARYGSIAAAIILMVGTGVWFSRPVDAAAFDDSVDDHIACTAAYPPDVAYDANVAYDASRIAGALDTAYQSILNAVPHHAAGYELIDAHMCPYQGRNYAHLVYRGDGKMLSVFAETAVRGRLPLTHESPRKGFLTTGASSAGHQVFVVADAAVPPPPSVVNELMQSTLSFVKKTRALAH
jgi:anti-sigma factor RsiW